MHVSGYALQLCLIAHTCCVQVWDVHAGQEKMSFEKIPEAIHSFEWNGDGSQIAASSKDRCRHQKSKDLSFWSAACLFLVCVFAFCLVEPVF